MKMYSLSCKDMGIPKCNYISVGESREETMKIATQHFIKAHPREVKESIENMSKDEIAQKMMENIIENDDEVGSV